LTALGRRADDQVPITPLHLPSGRSEPGWRATVVQAGGHHPGSQHEQLLCNIPDGPRPILWFRSNNYRAKLEFSRTINLSRGVRLFREWAGA